MISGCDHSMPGPVGSSFPPMMKYGSRDSNLRAQWAVCVPCDANRVAFGFIEESDDVIDVIPHHNVHHFVLF